MTEPVSEGGTDRGPWVQALGRHLHGWEVRLYRSRAGLEPEDAVAWAEADIGPYQAAAAIAEGRRVEDVLGERAERDRLWLGSGLSADEQAQWRAALFRDPDTAEPWRCAGFSPSAAGEWRSAGFDPTEALAWAQPSDVAGFSPWHARAWRDHGFSVDEADRWRVVTEEAEEAADALAQGMSPEELAVVKEDELLDADEVTEDWPSDEPIVWGRPWSGNIAVGQLSDIELLVALERETRVVEGCRTWEELFERLGVSWVEQEFGYLLDELWCCADADGPAGADRPIGWIPDDPHFDAGDWVTERPRVTDPEWLSLPEAMSDLAHGTGSPVSGDFIWWLEEDLPELARIAKRLGVPFIERQDLFDLIEQPWRPDEDDAPSAGSG